MKKLFGSVVLILMMAVSIFSQYNINFTSANQYQTVAGYRLHTVLDWSGVWFPPSDYEGAKLLLSTMPMGMYEPYDAIAILQSSLVERDPEFKLLGKMETNRIWYGRVICYYGGGQVFAQTPEFTFTLTDAFNYTGHTIWACAEYGWTTSFSFYNPSDISAQLTLSFYSQSGYLQPDETRTITINPGAESVFILNNTNPGFSGRIEFDSPQAPVEWMELMYSDFGSLQFAGALLPATQ